MNVEHTVKRQKNHINETTQKTGGGRQRTERSESEPWWRHQINWQRRTKRTRVTGKRKRRAHLGKAWSGCWMAHLLWASQLLSACDRWTVIRLGGWWDACQEHSESTYGHWANNWEPFPCLSMFQPATRPPVPGDGQYDIAQIWCNIAQYTLTLKRHGSKGTVYNVTKKKKEFFFK